MTTEGIKMRVASMREFFGTNKTKDVDFRIGYLKKLRQLICEHEKQIFDALETDLRKSNFEAYTTEVSLVLKEIDINIRNLKRWARPEYRPTPFIFWPSSSRILKEPYGIVLIIAPWNYPFQLIFIPLIAAISAGNCVVLKSSRKVPSINKVVEEIINQCFPTEYVSFFYGDPDTGDVLLDQRYDYIFFTGSPSRGKTIMEVAAKNLTPVTLELGGKSPCIIDSDADPAIAARRIVWGKSINTGQTCIAPDYLMVHDDIKESFVAEVEKAIREMYGENPQQSADYPRIISEKAMERLVGYLKEGDLVLGGKYDMSARYLEPTIITDIADDSPVMTEEIFGPLFPLKTFYSIDEPISFIKSREKPLALYYFTNDKKKAAKVLNETSSGGACINDTLIQLANHRLPFGGIGNSGMGQYHGKYGFNTFSHQKSVVYSSFSLDIKLKYPPYKKKLEKFKRFI
jgi:aldehyde dehydrogenase (NAD+)